jgi:hypothetical protein
LNKDKTKKIDSKTSLLSEIAETRDTFEKKESGNNTSIYNLRSSNKIYSEFESFILDKIQKKKTKFKEKIKTSTWNKERTILFKDYLHKTLNQGSHMFDEEYFISYFQKSYIFYQK